MKTTILGEVDGWTPLITDLVKECGLVTAAVYGRVWRYCNMEERRCTASLETISEDLGLNRATVGRHIHKLVEAGYLKDLTPDARLVPHVYVDTGKIKLKFGLKSVAESNTNPETVAQNNTTVAQNNTTVAESSLKRVFKKDSKKESHNKTCEKPQDNTRPIPEEEAIRMDKDEYLEGVRQALDRSIMKEVDGIDMSDYPADVATTIGLVCKLWHLQPPRKSKKKGNKYALWVEAARDLNEACGEFGLKAIESYREYFEQHMAQHQGVAPFNVNGPMSLVNSVRGYAGILRQSSPCEKVKQEQTVVKYAFGDTIYEVFVGKDGKPLSVGNVVSP